MSSSINNILSEEKYALITIPLASKSPAGRETVWIIVEDDYDKAVYSKFLTQDCYIFNSQKSDTDTSRSCLNVEYIVKKINRISSESLIFGIRDADYTRFDSSYSPPSNIFCTDYRDIEMMMFECKDVKDFFSSEYHNYVVNYNTSLSYAREIGYFRIFNDASKLGFSFKKKLKFDFLNNIDSYPPERLKSDLVQLFSDNCSEFSENNFNNFQRTVSCKSDFKICRGHDLVKIIVSLIRGHNRQNLSKETINTDLRENYSEECFFSSALFISIKAWCTPHNKIIWDRFYINT